MGRFNKRERARGNQSPFRGGMLLTRSGGVKLEADISYIEALAKMESEVDRVRKLDSLEHRLRLPVCHVGVVVEVRQVTRRMSAVCIGGVTKITRTRCS